MAGQAIFYCWFQGKKRVEKGKGKKGDEKGEKRAEKRGNENIKKTKMILMAIGNACMVCDSSFFQQEQDGVECKWVQCQKCDETSHAASVHPRSSQNIFLFESEDEEEYIYPNCTNLAEDSDNYNL